MIENIILGQNSLITKHLSKHLKNTSIFSANNFDEKKFIVKTEKRIIGIIDVKKRIKFVTFKEYLFIKR